jgi:hypothetical protein
MGCFYFQEIFVMGGVRNLGLAAVFLFMGQLMT